MPVSLVLGGQWGDEGKAKIIDSLAGRADFIVRFQGGANAGHTVVVGDERFAFHLIPSGILYPRAACVLGGGMVIDPLALIDEIKELTCRGLDVRGRIFISGQAHVVLPHHITMDRNMERRKGKGKIGSTGRGITPAYVDKIGRAGLRMSDFLLRPREFEREIAKHVRAKNRELRLRGMKELPSSKIVAQLVEARKILGNMITDTRVLLWKAIEDGANVLCEGAQGALLDVDHGTYPFVTSSNVTAGGAATGSGIPPRAFKRVIGVFKAYCTRVGNGPFPTEAHGRLGDKLRRRGNEFGTTTGRPRRCGWFDAVAARTAVKLNGITEVALSKLDVLDCFARIKICTGYELRGKTIEYFPADMNTLRKCRPKYTMVEGWMTETDARRFEDLPPKARRFVKMLERLIGCRISMISLGPERNSIIRLR